MGQSGFAHIDSSTAKAVLSEIDLSSTLQKSSNLSDISNVATALANLGITGINFTTAYKATVDMKSGVASIIAQPSGSLVFIPALIAVIPNTVNTVTIPGTGAIGSVGVAQFAAAVVMPSAIGKAMLLTSLAGIIDSYSSASPLYYKPTVQATATTLTCDFYTFGFQF